MSLESPAQDGEGSKREWSIELAVGAEYDTNVTVDEVDLSSGQADHATIVDFGVGMKQALGERASFALNYDLSQSNYDEFSQVNRRTQIIGADINAVVGDATAGFSAYYIDSQLDGDGFLEYLRLSPSVSGFLSRRWFARAAYVHSERRIDQRERRNADTNTGEIDLYYFHRGLRSYANIGYRYRREDAIAPELDFEAYGLKLRYIRRLDVFGKRLKSEVAVRYEVRDYLSAEPTIEKPRNDDRLRVKVDLELPINERLSWQVYYSYGDYESNLPRADFTQTIVGTKLHIRW
jgi:hypothetical protein